MASTASTTPKPPAATPSSFRAARAAREPGVYLSDSELLAAVHTSPRINAFQLGLGLGDGELLSLLGWVDQLKGAQRKVRGIVRASQPAAN